ncbi:STE20-related kinase adapter protein alpha isoform X1 [Latimeria chalumnae]|uniref:STE20-related kinase adapter protein alpha isoform X1 n=1 Tax=Latimeria chalumnae TaxID=7897 RepID=UPI0003C140F6|nr:PREDICTED: STE20-related kinase adapter protein alpha isoform X1 [Latimeria chalumnae]XP_005994679.1 PREDICTED: STE20-related kinase adapter protein alpha isoform X1 [Latimeria chalumnae]XP_005994680.1 PREDICTED: STE20-related kinase adapter protein alpha isoform X1 [Latimeria chalumnae]|eukprot:XP_005994678.1 PREDICTED: STE20-related kinase adapter protein alpha isoform X1 [Latimeria chalumnae]
MSFLRWVSEKLSVESLRDLELFGEQPQGDSQRKNDEASSESLASLPKRDNMSTFSPHSSSYELLTIIGSGLEDLMTVNLARYKPTGEYVAIRRINLESCTSEMVTFLQGELHVSKLFHHPNIVPYKATFIADNELWVATSFMAYGSAKDLIGTHFVDGMNEMAIAYILQGVLKALDYIHHMGYVHRSVNASHILISSVGQVYLSGLRTIVSMINHGQRLKVIHDFPKYSVKVLPWLSPEVLQQNLQGYDAKSDIYSLGITACELANGHVPFKDMPATQMLLEKLNGTVPCLLDTTTIPPEELTMKTSRSGADSGIGEGTAACSIRPANGEPSQHPYNRTFSPHFHNFVELCLQRDPEHRPSASALLNHSFFKQIKRRACEALPELLHPVTPLTKFEGPQLQDPRVFSRLVSSLEQLDVDDWDF